VAWTVESVDPCTPYRAAAETLTSVDHCTRRGRVGVARVVTDAEVRDILASAELARHFEGDEQIKIERMRRMPHACRNPIRVAPLFAVKWAWQLP
jgi:hypothetical protein